jgi:hypothetical protein
MTQAQTIATKTDVGVNEWLIDDDVIRFRQWGSEIAYTLPFATTPELVIGTADGCTIRLLDRHGFVSRRHARVTREGDGLVVRDLDSKNGLLVDGSKRAGSVVVPGVEIGIGGITLVAESPRFIALRSFVMRIVGWSTDRLEIVDLALRSIRHAATRRAPLVLCGDSNLVAIAHEIHRRIRGDERPFVVCDPRRKDTAEATVRAAPNYDKSVPAMVAAANGSLCVWSKRLPRDFRETREGLRDPASRVLLIVCAQEVGDAKVFLGSPIVLPPLAARAGEIGRIVDEYIADAVKDLGADRPLGGEDRAWIDQHATSSLAEIEKSARRLVAIRKAGGVSAAAALLGMSHNALSRWIGRRPLPKFHGAR